MFCKSATLYGLQRSLLPCVELSDKAVFTQVVRWRKRRWTAPSQTKMWFVPKRHETPEEERQKRLVLTSRYSKQITAISKMFREEYAEGLQQNRALKRQEKEEDDAYRNMINEKWNTETGRIREARIAKLREEREENKLQMLLKMEEEREKQRQAALKLVEEAKRDAEHKITMDNWDLEVEKILNTRVNYNFAIDMEGNKYIEMPDGSAKLGGKESDSEQHKPEVGSGH